MLFRLQILFGLLMFSGFVQAQVTMGSDELFKAARTASFEEKNDTKAITILKEALELTPQNADVQVFLGRLYSWQKQYDSAVYHFEQVLNYSQANEDASIAYTDLEYWKDNYNNALVICNNGLLKHSKSEDLLLRKAKILNALKRFKEASEITDQLLKIDNKNTAALSLASSLKEVNKVNKIGVNYEYAYFDKQFKQPWHLASLSYSRFTKLGTIAANVNYANRFGSSGWQGEVDAYPRISKTFYSYISVGYSPGKSVFPKYRGGFSLYANLPHSYEAEVGIRYLNFGTSTYVYTAYVGKYYSNFLFGARTYITPGTGGASRSYNAIARYYLKSADDYIGLSIGSGISPDDKTVNVQYNNKNKFTSQQATITFNHSIARHNIIAIKTGWIRQEFQAGITGNQVNLSLGYQKRF